MSARSAFRARPLTWFFALAFLLSWYPWLLGLLGVPKASGMNPLGLLAAALIVTGACDGWAGVKALLGRIGHWRVGWNWTLAAVAVPVAILAVAAALNLALGADTPTAAQWAGWPEIVDRFIFAFLFVGLGEEPAWRGTALPALYRHVTPLTAALWLGAVWALWHVPMMGTEFAWNVVPCFLISVFAGSVVLAWLYNGSGQSVLLCMVTHATVNSVGAGYVFRLFGGADSQRLWWIYAAAWVAAAALVAWRAGPELAREKPRESAAAKAASADVGESAAQYVL